MPYSDGVYTPPTGAENAVSGQIIRSAIWNTVNTDISSALTNVGLGVNIQAVMKAQSPGGAISTGVKGTIEIPLALTINSWKLMADQAGSIVVDIWVGAFGSYPLNSGSSITGSAPPTITTAQSASSSTLTGWTTGITSGSIMTFNIVSAATIRQITLALDCGRN